jgi:hypothetical protein
MRPLIDVAIELHLDYQRLRMAAIRGDVRAERIHGRWLVDPADAERFKQEVVTAGAA